MLSPAIMRSNALSPMQSSGTTAAFATTLSILPDAAKLVFRGKTEAIEAAGAHFGVKPSLEACRFAAVGGRSVYWLGPDEWLFQAVNENPIEVFGGMSVALQGQACSLVDVSHRSDGIAVAGPTAALVLNHGCPLDLSLKAFPVGMCTRTVLGKASLLLSRSEEHVFHVDVWRSFAPYVWQFLDEARSLS
ncbi:sarcosine oxidase subunit gamma [Bradyrhizobium sp. NFR13]|jgi:sarcosine oxidase subunit gamma|uniref:sarcosine oxidase subunit gamma n=1 Tax=Nitrobacteraceae TaxID=41294 RepID=UPI0008EE1CE4|nr:MULTISPECIES: sarcosine oxidase subunit gamma family protein [Nitrobacteraceae]UFS75012.1 sarcosine oxidase subunit gamma [Tardiphaga sp. 37S4]SFL76338.1 sarcosine oxidase subunit gamma [Bradyrhizobium sp. NFR13]